MTASFWKKLLQHGLPSSKIHHLTASARPGAANVTVVTNNHGRQHPSECVRIVLPSDWASLDMSNDIFFRNVFEIPNNQDPERNCIENTPIVQNRNIVCAADLVMWASYDSAICPCEPGDKISIPCASSPRTLSHQPYTSDWTTMQAGTPLRTTVVARVGILWCVSKNVSTADTDSCQQHELDVFNLLKDQIYFTYADISKDITNQRKMRQTLQKDILQLCLGDVCAFLRPDPPVDTNGVVCLFVASPVMHAYGQTLERLLWVCVEKPNGNTHFVKILASATVNGLHLWLSGRRTSPHFPKGNSRSKGTLPCGTPYYVYCMALYADGFQQHKSLTDVRSVTGVYMMPLGLPLELRQSPAAARVITLIPHNQDERKLFKIIEDDVLRAGRDGVTVIDPYGNIAKVFIDMVSFFADYPAVTSMCDVRGHTATAFCTFCSMQKRDEVCGRNLLYSTLMHSRRLGFMRFDARTIAIRSGEPPADLCKALGLSKQDRETAAEAPLMRYASSVRRIPASVRNALPHQLTFDSCLNVAAAPDHLFTGLIADVLFVCMMTLDNDDRREEAEQTIMCNAYANGLKHSGKFLKWDKRTCTGLRSMSMSTRVGLLICAAPFFEEEYNRRSRNVFLLPGKLQRLVAVVYHLPSEEAEGPEAHDYFTEEGVLEAHGERYRTVCDYIALCRAVFRSNHPYGKALNKPNVHRAIELCLLTIPSFGHARNCSEMALESEHRNFKRWLEKNSHADAHLTAVERSLLKDWLSRCHGLYMQWTNENGELRERAERGLLRLLLGTEAMAMDPKRQGAPEFLEQFRTAMKDAFQDPVLKEMPSSDQCAALGSTAYAWETAEVISDEERSGTTLQEGLKLLENWYACNGMHEVDLIPCRTAKYMVTESVCRERRSHAYNRVTRGCVVSIVCKRTINASHLVRGAAMGERRCTVRFFAVCDIVRASCAENWCVGKELTVVEGGYSSAGSPVVIVILGRRVRRVAAFHICGDACRVDLSRGIVTHSRTVLRGGVYRIVQRKDGYPPHLG